MYQCTNCGSTDVEALTWVDLNSGEEMDGEVGEYFCRKCDKHTNVQFHDDDQDEEPTNHKLKV